MTTPRFKALSDVDPNLIPGQEPGAGMVESSAPTASTTTTPPADDKLTLDKSTAGATGAGLGAAPGVISLSDADGDEVVKGAGQVSGTFDITRGEETPIFDPSDPNTVVGDVDALDPGPTPEQMAEFNRRAAEQAAENARDIESQKAELNAKLFEEADTAAGGSNPWRTGIRQGGFDASFHVPQSMAEALQAQAWLNNPINVPTIQFIQPTLDRDTGEVLFSGGWMDAQGKFLETGNVYLNDPDGPGPLQAGDPNPDAAANIQLIQQAQHVADLRANIQMVFAGDAEFRISQGQLILDQSEIAFQGLVDQNRQVALAEIDRSTQLAVENLRRTREQELARLNEGISSRLTQQEAQFQSALRILEGGIARDLERATSESDRAAIRERGAEERKTLEARAETDRAAQERDLEAQRKRLDQEFDRRERELQANQQRELARLDQAQQDELELLRERGVEERFTMESRFRLDTAMLERNAELESERQNVQNQFLAQQNSLDRALAALQIEEAGRSAQAAEQLRAQQLELEQKQFQLGVFQTLASSPEILYFMGQSGAVDQFMPLFEGAGLDIRGLIDSVNEGSLANIQQFSRLSGAEQGIEAFRRTAQTGVTDTAGALRGAAPRSLVQRTAFNTPIQPGRPSTSDRARLTPPR